jgi:hypothetical protein
MLRLLHAAMLTLVVLGSPAAAATAQAPAVSQDPAFALAERVAPAEIMLPLEMKIGKQAFYMGFEADAEGKALLEEYPNLPDVLWAAVEPELVRYSAADHPKFLDRLAALYRARLTTREMAGLYEFYGSSTGRKLVREAYRGLDANPVLADLAKQEGDVSAESLQAARGAGLSNVVSSLDAADEAALLGIGKILPLEKWRQIGAETQKLTLEWVNQEDPVLEARIEALIEAAFEKYLAGKDGAG